MQRNDATIHQRGCGLRLGKQKETAKREEIMRRKVRLGMGTREEVTGSRIPLANNAGMGFW